MRWSRLIQAVDDIASALEEGQRNRAIEALQAFVDRGSEGSGDSLFDLLTEQDQTAPRVGVAHSILRVLLALSVELGDDEQPWFASLDGVVDHLCSVLARSPDCRQELYDLLLTPGLFSADHLGQLAELSSNPVLSFAELNPLERLFAAAQTTDEHEAALVALSECPHASLRIAANGRLLQLNADRVAVLNDQIVNGDRRDRPDLFAGICEGASHDDLTFVLLDLHDRGIKVDVAVGLPRVLARTGGERYDEIIYLHGRSQDSDEFRTRAVAAITHHVTATTATDKLIRQLVEVCRTDPSAAVRGSALIGLSTCWDHDDRAGLDRFISQLGTAADMSPYAQPARDNLLTSAELRANGSVGPATVSWDVVEPLLK